MLLDESALLQEMITAELCAKRHRSVRERGFAKLFTVLKKVNEDGIKILRTILDCVTANEAFQTPDPVNLANIIAIRGSRSELERVRARGGRAHDDDIHVCKILDLLCSEEEASHALDITLQECVSVCFVVLVSAWHWAFDSSMRTVLRRTRLSFICS